MLYNWLFHHALQDLAPFVAAPDSDQRAAYRMTVTVTALLYWHSLNGSFILPRLLVMINLNILTPLPWRGGGEEELVQDCKTERDLQRDYSEICSGNIMSWSTNSNIITILRYYIKKIIFLGEVMIWGEHSGLQLHFFHLKLCFSYLLVCFFPSCIVARKLKRPHGKTTPSLIVL